MLLPSLLMLLAAVALEGQSGRVFQSRWEEIFHIVSRGFRMMSQSPLVMVVALLMAGFYAYTTRALLKGIHFRAWLRYPFCLLVLPVFLALCPINYGLTEHYLPKLFAAASAGHTGDTGAALAALAALPLGVVVCLAWYWALKLIDRQLSRA